MLRNFVSWSFLLLLLSAGLLASGPFKPVHTYLSGGMNTVSVAAADVNGDGKLDIVVSNSTSCSTCSDGSVGILLGNGDGTFQAAKTYDTGGIAAGGVAVADVDGDGTLDVVVTNACAAGTSCEGNSNTGSVAVLRGNGDGTFQPAQVYSSGNQSRYLVLGDFNGDGKLDMVVAGGCNGCGQPNMSVLLGNGDGTFQVPQTYLLPGDPLGIAAGDIDGDGKLDIVAGLESEGGAQYGPSAVLLGQGDGTFSDPQTLYPAGAYPALADMNGDGKLDLVVTTPCGDVKCKRGGVGVLLGNGDGSFQTLQNYSSGGYDADFIAVADVNLDGKLDVLVANYAGRVGVLLGTGDGVLSSVQLFSQGKGGPFSMALADVNGDGKPDLLVAIYDLNNEINTGGVGVLLNNTFFATTTTLSSTPNPSTQGQMVTFKATVVSDGSKEPTGKVVFKNGSKQLGSATLIGGVASLTKKNLPVGSLSITATYKGDTQSSPSTSPVLIQVVNPASKR